jgi:hypothetical protein
MPKNKSARERQIYFSAALSRPPRAQVFCLYQKAKRGACRKRLFKKITQKKTKKRKAKNEKRTIHFQYSVAFNGKGWPDFGANVAYAVRSGNGAAIRH